MLDRRHPSAKPRTNTGPRCSSQYMNIMSVRAATPYRVTQLMPDDVWLFPTLEPGIVRLGDRTQAVAGAGPPARAQITQQ